MYSDITFGTVSDGEKYTTGTAEIDTGTKVALEIQVIDNVSDFDSLETAWDELTESSASFIYQSFQWNRTWWRHFGEGKQLFIITFYDSDQLVGIIPLFRDTVTVFSCPFYSCLRFIGSNVNQPRGERMLGLIPYSSYLDVIIKPGCEKDVYSKLIAFLIRRESTFDEVVLEEISECSTLLQTFVPSCAAADVATGIDNCSTVSAINLEQSWSEYLNSISKNRRSHARRALKKIVSPEHKIFDIREVQSEEELLQKFDLFVQMHQDRWNRIGHLGAFRQRRMCEFYRDIVLRFFRKGWLQLKILAPVDQKNHCIAIDLNFKYKDRVYGEQCAIDDRSDYYRLGPGTSLLNKTLKEISASDIRWYDFGRGDFSYKQSMATCVTQNKMITIHNSNKVKHIKARLVKSYVKNQRRIMRETAHIRFLVQNSTSFRLGLQNILSYFRTRFTQKLNFKG